MAGKPGRSGTNKGKDKPWADALRIVMFRENPAGTKRLLQIAECCAKAAEQGDMAAIREIGDRLDGKPAQESTVTFDDKRDATDWTRAELVAFLNDAKPGGDGIAATNGCDREPDSIH